MKTADLTKLRKKMEKNLEPNRYEHTLSVAYTAANLAAVHGEDVQKALVAGVLHDCAKSLSHKKQIALCDKYHVHLSPMEAAENSPLLHAKTGSILAREEYGIEDEDILNAISYHTTGRPQMSVLEKIIYIADYIEPGRRHMKRFGDGAPMERLAQIRQMAYRDLDETLLNILSDTLDYLQSKGSKIDPMTRTTYEYYK
ncbi:MAG: bis(5'-nucleosyl)-tetraphosphatase (symmetrical) YqeK [Lachnospiraceae bacterium]|nr:bis(5'-nucleosyl)-tetraphosphatase (symmetrical) YqeK [Lachnospiraceae bacterium]